MITKNLFGLFRILFAASVLVMSCAVRTPTVAGKEETVSKGGCLVGRIFVVGNEPFAHLAVEVSGSCDDSTRVSPYFERDEMVAIDADSTTASLLMKNQGRSFRLYFDKVDQVPSGKSIRVKSAIQEIG